MKTTPTTKIGLGLAALGRPEYINIRSDKDIDKTEEAFKNTAFSVLDEAYNRGVRYFDTAPSYGKGEAFLQEWDAKTQHKDAVLGTKWGYTYVANWELGYSGKHEIKEHSLEKLVEQWEVSKAMLPSLKYYQVHSATFDSGILENQAVLVELNRIKTETGLHIGISTSGENQAAIITEALKIEVKGKALFDSFQVSYNVFEQSTFDVLKAVMENGKTVIIKEALANGRVFESEQFPKYKEVYVILKQLSKKYNVGVDAIALRFVMDSLNPHYVLSGASNVNQLEENLKANDFELSAEDLQKLKSISVEPKFYWEERSALDWN
ncbi:aldo/keto reductase [Tamlana sp. 2_MG-2023]|nr:MULTISPECIES: aldo/keto reductase [unclassified Tamlana]MDO6760950.1 aldo/keto reductase [Tamlana sp. 2_MG-2023]MDO6791206.1 aldo/keto reductase [Tamlana sp. 1_MG-2023]